MDQVDGFECVCPEQWVGATCQLGKGPAAGACVCGCALCLWRLLCVLLGLRAHRPPCLVHRRQ